MSLKVKCDGAIGLPIWICGFLLFNSNIWPNWAHLLDIGLRHLSDLDFDISMTSKVNAIVPLWATMQDFLLVFYSTIWRTSTVLRDIAII